MLDFRPNLKDNGEIHAEFRFYGLHHILALVTSRVRIGARSRHGVFRGKDHALAMVLHKLAEKRFARPVGVKVRGVDEIPPGLAKGIVHLACFVLGRTPAPFLAEGHCAERRLRNPESGVAQNSVSHVKSPFRYGVFILAPLVCKPVTWNRPYGTILYGTVPYRIVSYETTIVSSGNSNMLPWELLLRNVK